MSSNHSSKSQRGMRAFHSTVHLVKQSLRGDTEYDYTQGSISRASLLLAIPMILELALESVFAVVDIFFVAQLGTTAVAVVGLTESMITILYALAIGVGMGTTALVARRVGEGDRSAASVAAGQALWLGALMSLVVAGIGLIFAEDLLRLMGAEEAVISSGSGYTRIMFGGNFTIVFLFMLNAIFRGAGDVMLALKSLWLANAINIVLDPLLIFGPGPFPELGVEGAAIATNLGRGIGVIYALSFLLGRDGRIKLGLNELRLRFGIIVSLLRISAGGVAQYLLATASWIFLMQIVAGFGSAVVAGYVIAIRVVMFTILPAWGLSNAAATLAGQNLGAGKPDRAEAAVWSIAMYCAGYMALVGAICWFFAAPILGFFTQEAQAIESGALALRIVSLGYIPAGFGMALTQAFNGAGDTLTPTVINFIAFWIVQVPLAYALALLLGFGSEGVFWAIFASDLLIGAIACWAFARGRWKLREV